MQKPMKQKTEKKNSEAKSSPLKQLIKLKNS